MELTKLRKNSKKTIADVASQLKVTSSCICQWEKGKRFPPIHFIPRLSAILNCTIEEIVLCFCEDEAIPG